MLNRMQILFSKNLMTGFWQIIQSENGTNGCIWKQKEINSHTGVIKLKTLHSCFSVLYIYLICKNTLGSFVPFFWPTHCAKCDYLTNYSEPTAACEEFQWGQNLKQVTLSSTKKWGKLATCLLSIKVHFTTCVIKICQLSNHLWTLSRKDNQLLQHNS